MCSSDLSNNFARAKVSRFRAIVRRHFRSASCAAGKQHGYPNYVAHKILSLVAFERVYGSKKGPRRVANSGIAFAGVWRVIRCGILPCTSAEYSAREPAVRGAANPIPVHASIVRQGGDVGKVALSDRLTVPYLSIFRDDQAAPAIKNAKYPDDL